ncbi:alpha/beta fold hydrolase [Thalassolituus sp. UBA3500]|uniref:alpha/beta fold hydrolase n=1 Tax=Thalassolituus sp. UBA3500 TaxID=1947664 RepID=UPI00263B58F9|nr:alpha/beta fold hydrolase [Thalassolituus sp. UBA3500]|tara:strand:- start:6302 stop:6952 length:651 start_codon:yes stop_codon:yes gene_type:complete
MASEQTQEMLDCTIINGKEGLPTLILAHGAGADLSSEFMTDMAGRIATHGVRVVRFNFPYMIKRAQDGKKRPPDRAPKLIDAYSDLIEALNTPCVIGGKSMGGRIASMLANGSDVPAQVQGCIALGYPFHPPGKPDNLRTEHLLRLTTPTLIAQGTRDAMGTKEEVLGCGLDKTLELVWLEDGNHDLKPRKASGFTHDAHLEATAKHVADFVKRCL